MKPSTLTACALLVVALAGQAFGSSERGSEVTASAHAGAGVVDSAGRHPIARAPRSEKPRGGTYRGHSAAYWAQATVGQHRAKRAAQRKAHRLARRVSRLRFELRETRRMLRGARRERGELAKRLAELEGGAGGGWTESATAYASWEGLTGCVSPGRCVQACGGYLDDGAATVAANGRLGLSCNDRIVVCHETRPLCSAAVVRDVTLSHFGFEFTAALAKATGAQFDEPRTVRWRRA